MYLLTGRRFLSSRWREFSLDIRCRGSLLNSIENGVVDCRPSRQVASSGFCAVLLWSGKIAAVVIWRRETQETRVLILSSLVDDDMHGRHYWDMPVSAITPLVMKACWISPCSIPSINITR